MSTNFRFSQQQNKPQRRLGRRSLAMGNHTNTNITLNGTLNNTAKYVTSEITHKEIYEPSCVSTPLPDHTRNKENIFLSSIKPVLPSSPKSARKVPYQRRLGRRSMALRTDIQLEKDSLNDSLTRMKNINSSLKLSEPKHSEAPASQAQASNGFSFLNLERYDFLRKYFPAPPVSQTQPSPSPVKSISNECVRRNLRSNPLAKCESVESLVAKHGARKSPGPEYKFESVFKTSGPSSPAKTEVKYESLLKNIATKYESIAETSESPTITCGSIAEASKLPAITCASIAEASKSPTITCESIAEASKSPTITITPDDEETDDFLKKSLTGVHKLPESPGAGENSESKYGSFLGDVSPRQDTLVDEPNTGDSDCPVRMASDAIDVELEPECVSSAADKEDEALNRTFEMEEDESLLFKTPLAPKFLKLDESAVTFKTPMSSVFSRFQNMDDNNDSFVENERTIMLQFNREAPAVTNVKSVCEENESMPASTGICDAAGDNIDITGNRMCVAEAVGDAIDIPGDKQPTSLQEFVLHQRKQLEMLVHEQAQQLRQFLDTQKEAYDRFIANMDREKGTDEVSRDVDCTLQRSSTPTIIICEPESTGSQMQSSVGNGSHRDLAANKTNSAVYKSKFSSKLNRSASRPLVTKQEDQSILHESTVGDPDDTHVRSKPRQSLAFSKFKKNCSILKTPSRTRCSMANTTAVFTPGSLSICVRDQLEELADD